MSLDTPVISVVIVITNDVVLLDESLSSLLEQTYSDFEVVPVFCGDRMSSLEAAEVLCGNYFPRRSILKPAAHHSVPYCLNNIIFSLGAKYVTIISCGDIFHPTRLESFVASAEERQGQLLFSYAELIDNNAQPVDSDSQLFKSYSHGLLSNIAAHPCLSFTILWYDLILSPSNLFFTLDLFKQVKGFSDYELLFYYDFTIRCSRFHEPIILTNKTISCKVRFTDRHLRETQASIDERAIILREHLLSLMAQSPVNNMSDLFASHPFMFAGVPWSQAISDAIDGLIETRHLINRKTMPDKIKLNKKWHGRGSITLLTHELSLTGAPVIILEMSQLLISSGYNVEVLSPSDGPLRDEFEKNGVDVIILPKLHARLGSLERYIVTHPESRHGIIWGTKKVTHLALRIYKKIIEKRRNIKLSTLAKKRILVNSVAAWSWVYELLKDKDARVIWYIHETFDPKWIITASADRLFRLRILQGSLQMIYGSNATRIKWDMEGYPGATKYWSGIKIDKYNGDQFENITKNHDKKRTILNVGTFGTRKGTEVLLEAFAFGRTHGIIPAEVNLCIIGSPRISSNQEARDLFLRAQRSDLRGSVHIVGQIQPGALDLYYDEAELYVHASFFDCMPIALLTAMARGLPIVATNVDGCGEAIINNVTGLLVPPRSPKLLAAAIGALLNNDQLATSYAQNARAHFRDTFAVESTYEAVEELLCGIQGITIKDNEDKGYSHGS